MMHEQGTRRAFLRTAVGGALTGFGLVELAGCSLPPEEQEKRDIELRNLTEAKCETYIPLYLTARAMQKRWGLRFYPTTNSLCDGLLHRIHAITRGYHTQEEVELIRDGWATETRLQEGDWESRVVDHARRHVANMDIRGASSEVQQRTREIMDSVASVLPGYAGATDAIELVVGGGQSGKSAGGKIIIGDEIISSWPRTAPGLIHELAHEFHRRWMYFKHLLFRERMAQLAQEYIQNVDATLLRWITMDDESAATIKDGNPLLNIHSDRYPILVRQFEANKGKFIGHDRDLTNEEKTDIYAFIPYYNYIVRLTLKALAYIHEQELTGVDVSRFDGWRKDDDIQNLTDGAISEVGHYYVGPAQKTNGGLLDNISDITGPSSTLAVHNIAVQNALWDVVAIPAVREQPSKLVEKLGGDVNKPKPRESEEELRVRRIKERIFGEIEVGEYEYSAAGDKLKLFEFPLNPWTWDKQYLLIQLDPQNADGSKSHYGIVVRVPRGRYSPETLPQARITYDSNEAAVHLALSPFDKVKFHIADQDFNGHPNLRTLVSSSQNNDIQTITIELPPEEWPLLEYRLARKDLKQDPWSPTTEIQADMLQVGRAAGVVETQFAFPPFIPINQDNQIYKMKRFYSYAADRGLMLLHMQNNPILLIDEGNR